jgi:hypothetical protein
VSNFAQTQRAENPTRIDTPSLAFGESARLGVTGGTRLLRFLGPASFMRLKMMRSFVVLVLAAIALAVQATAGTAQLDPLNPVPGGATGANVFCLQAGDLNTGAFVRMFLQTGTGAWEEREFPKFGAVKLEEKKRDEVTVELFDAASSSSIQFDFVRKRVKVTRENPADNNWTDAYHILSATDKEGSADCISLAARSAPPAAGAAAVPPRTGASPVLMITIRLGAKVVIPPGTKLTATSGPPCPAQPGFFLCPNKFSCAPDGGVCCPGAGSCGPGGFCDRFIPNSCIGPADPSFCQGTGNPLTGVSLHCAPGIACTMPGATCP